MKKQGIATFLRRKQYVIAGAIIAIAAVGTTMLYSSNQEKERQQMEAELAEEMNEKQPQLAAVEEETEAAQEASAVIPPANPIKEGEATTELTGEETETAQIVKEENILNEEIVQENKEVAQEQSQTQAQTVSSQQTLHFNPKDGMLWPKQGNVILNYSMDATVYFATLDQYKYNPAVIIEGEVNDKVYSVAKGKVTDISSNEVTGCTMTVDLGDGYQAIYGQLKEPNFAKGDYVEAGHVLGFVAEPTKYFSVEGSNLYFELQKDGVPVNPVEFFE